MSEQWLAACRRMVDAQRDLFAADATIASRTRYDGVGEGGDDTLVIDRQAEDIVFSELEKLHEAGESFTAISEERGTVEFGDGAGAARVVIDPIDGSVNARRTIPGHCLSVALTSGGSMADTDFGYIYDFGADEEFRAVRGEGAWRDEVRLDATGPGFGLELIGMEGVKPVRALPLIEALDGKVFRIRSVGAIALALCWVAAGRLDGMLTARACRSVDAAAAQLIVREAGGLIEFPGHALEETPLDLDARYHVTAALDQEGFDTLREVQRLAEPIGESW
jgi:myo-inositol-1(or 4)-monophosphatase